MAEPYVHRIRVRYGEVDMQRVVFNAHYLAYCDDAVESWLQVLGLDVFEQGWDFMLKAAALEWQGSATVHDHLDIAVAIERWGTTSFDVGFTGTVEARPVFTCRITYVGVRAGTQEKMPAPPEIRELLGGPPPS
ncbi:MAG: acyl-CoA thioester hydrolase [Acidimicrobiaceae bacterium]|nr:acyl-CoA thioester hydrolase [Acidimicrobiaceae bacterium]